MTLLLGFFSPHATATPGSVPDLELPGQLVFEDADSAGQFRLGVGDLEPAIDFQLLQANGDPVPLDSVTSVSFRIRNMAGDRPLLGGTVSILDATEGRCRYVLQTGDTLIPDVYYARAVLVWGDRPMTMPLARPAIVVISNTR